MTKVHSSEIISTLCGLTGVIMLSEGNVILSQSLFCVANPILAFSSWKAGAKSTAFLFLIYELFSIRGVLICLGGLA